MPRRMAEQDANQFFTSFVTWIRKQVWPGETGWHVAQETKADSLELHSAQHEAALFLVAWKYNPNEHDYSSTARLCGLRQRAYSVTEGLCGKAGILHSIILSITAPLHSIAAQIVN